MDPIKIRRIRIEDDLISSQLFGCLEEIRAFVADHKVDQFIIKSRAQRGKMAGGGVTFKLETLIQLNGVAPIVFVHPATLSMFSKKNISEYPEDLPVYLQSAYAAAAYGLIGNKK